MQTVFLIGNGFDVNLGLKTRYAEFYEYYLNIPTNNENVKNLKLHLKENSLDFWSDLEIAMGKYTSKFNSFAQVEEVYDDINDEMQKYISIIEDTPLNQDIDVELLRKNISSPESFLSPAENNRVMSMYKNITTNNNIIDIINFNYTATIEKILGYDTKKIEIAPAIYHSSFKTILNSILHIHGTVGDPILGVDNVSQIENEQLIKNGEIIGYLVKPSINTALGNLVDEKVKKTILNANLICIYGMSLGETDATWWRLVGERLVKGAIVILYVYDDNANNILARKKTQFNNKWRNKFFNVAGISDSKRVDLEKRLIIAPNTKIFDIKANTELH